MKLIDVTNSHFDLVSQQLANTDAQVVRVFTIGPTTVIYSEAPTHANVVIVNKSRKIRDAELDFVVEKLFKQTNPSQLEILSGPNFIEVEKRF